MQSIYILVIYLFYIIQANGHAIGYLMLWMFWDFSVHEASRERARLSSAFSLTLLTAADARQFTRSIFPKEMTRLNGQRMDANVVVLGTDNVGKSGMFFFSS